MTAHVGGRLSVAAVKAAGPGKHPDGANLYLQVGPTGTKSWYLRYTLRGRRHDLGLGPYPLIGLAEARERAASARRQLLDGIDPLQARQAQRTAKAPMNFAQAASAYVAGHEAGWRSADHKRQWRASLERYVLPEIGERPVAGIDTDDVLRIVEPLWADRTETGTRVLNRIALVLDWATARNLRSGDNPARWKGHLDKVLAKRSKLQPEQHFEALPWAKMPEFLAKLRADQQPGARAAELLTLTAARTGEVRFAEWSEFDAEARLWVIPAARMKGHREHRVPLSDAALTILAGLERKGSLLFPRLGQHAILKAVQRVAPGVTAHGMSAAFETWAADHGFSRDIYELATAHAVGSRVERAYQRSDLLARRRELADRWAAFCDGSDRNAKVIELPRRSA